MLLITPLSQKNNLAQAFSQLKIEDEQGRNLVIKGKRGNRE